MKSQEEVDAIYQKHAEFLANISTRRSSLALTFEALALSHMSDTAARRMIYDATLQFAIKEVLKDFDGIPVSSSTERVELFVTLMNLADGIKQLKRDWMVAEEEV